MEPLRLDGRRVLMFVGDIYEDLELLYPRLRLIEDGAAVVLAGLDAPGTVYTGKHGYPVKSDARVESLDASAFDALVIPGGFMPDRLRRDADAVAAETREILFNRGAVFRRQNREQKQGVME